MRIFSIAVLLCPSVKKTWKPALTAAHGTNVVQAHLYCDHIITLAISENVDNPRALNLDRLSFSQKLNLISALALMDGDFVVFLKKLNQIRNKISHDLDFELTEQHVSSLLNAVPGYLGEFIKSDLYRGDEGSLQRVLIVTLMHAEINRQTLSGNRLIRQKSMLRLRAALDQVGQHYNN